MVKKAHEAPRSISSGSTEFRLCVETCRWIFAGGSLGETRRLARSVDWPKFIQEVRYQRVQGLAWSCLRQARELIPPDVAEVLALDAAEIAAASLRASVECRDLVAEFNACGIKVLFLKGLTVGALAYANPNLKMAWDIDLLAARSDLDSVAALLRDRGYRTVIPPSFDDLQSWHGSEKESVWTRDGFHIELHTRLADNPLLIHRIGIDSPRQDVEVASGIVLPTLADEELFAYLCVHGASSAWFRLKWISDFAALLHGRGAEDIRRIYDQSQDLGAGRAAGQALQLADKLFGVLDPIPELRDQLASDRATRLLTGAALRMLTTGAREPTERRLGTLPIHWTQVLLLPGLAYKLSELRRQLRSILRHGIG